MKINELKIPDDEQYSEEDINAVINQAVNGTWGDGMLVNDYIESTNPGYFQRRALREQNGQ
jgi:hypothetical protein